MQVDKNDIGDSEAVFFFPKENPPVAVTATSLEEAEGKLKDIKDIKDTMSDKTN